MEMWRQKLINENYKELARAVVDRAIQDTNIKKTAGKNSTETKTRNIKASAFYFLRHFEESIFYGLIEPSPSELAIIKKAARL